MSGGPAPKSALVALLVAVVTAGCAAPADAPLLAKIEDVQDAAALVAVEARYDAGRDRLPLKDACDVARGAILEGRLRDAIECAMRTFYLGQETKDAKLTAEGARVLAEAYGFAGKLDLSNRFAKLALREAARLSPGERERDATEAIAWRVLGENWSRESRWADALDAFKRAESLPPVSTFSRDTLAIAVANTQLRAGTPAIARETFSRIAGREAAPARVRAQALRGLGDVLAAENRLAEAKEQFRAALRLARRAGSLPEIAWALERLGRTALRTGDRNGAVGHWHAAVDVVESLRAEFRSEEFRSAFFGTHADLYDELIALLATDGRAADAFAASERSRARALLDMMAHRTRVVDVAASGKIRDTERAREELALLRTDARLGEGDGGTRGARMAALEARLREVAAGPPAGEASVDLILRSAATTRTAAQVQARLGADGALLEYHVLPGETLVWRLDRSGIRLHRIGAGRAALRAMVAELREAIVARRADVAERSRALYRLLVAPALGTGTPAALTIVPHDVLHFLPFGALTDGERFLLERTLLTVAPSASAIESGDADRPRGVPAELMAFGNPVTDPQYRLPRLPGAEAEVRAIGAAFPGATVVTGAQASKRRFVAEAPKRPVVHVAAHAVFDDADPMASAIFLAPDGRERGRLEAREFFGLRFDATRLMVLSACQTGLGRIGRGDEVAGLSRALLAAGVRSLVLSLWEVEDASTARLMTAFYENLRTASIAESMRRAQLAVMKTHPEPFFWAPFFVVDLHRP